MPTPFAHPGGRGQLRGLQRLGRVGPICSSSPAQGSGSQRGLPRLPCLLGDGAPTSYRGHWLHPGRQRALCALGSPRAVGLGPGRVGWEGEWTGRGPPGSAELDPLA